MAETENLPATAKESAIMNMLQDADERRDELLALFDARKAYQDRKEEVRREVQVDAFRDVLVKERQYDPIAIAMLSRLRNVDEKSPARRARIWFQLLIGGNALGLDRDVVLPPPEERDDGPMFDRTGVGRRQGGTRVGPQGQALRTVSENVDKAKVDHRLGERMLENARAGLPMHRKVGRPSNVVRATERWAQDRLEEEQQEQRRAALEARAAQAGSGEQMKAVLDAMGVRDGQPAGESESESEDRQTEGEGGEE